MIKALKTSCGLAMFACLVLIYLTALMFESDSISLTKAILMIAGYGIIAAGFFFLVRTCSQIEEDNEWYIKKPQGGRTPKGK